MGSYASLKGVDTLKHSLSYLFYIACFVKEEEHQCLKLGP